MKIFAPFILLVWYKAIAAFYEHRLQLDYFKFLTRSANESDVIKLNFHPGCDTKDRGIFHCPFKCQWDAPVDVEAFEKAISHCWNRNVRRKQPAEGFKFNWRSRPETWDQMRLYLYRSKLYFGGSVKVFYREEEPEDGDRLVNIYMESPPMTPGEVVCLNVQREHLQKRCRALKGGCLELLAHCKAAGMAPSKIKTAKLALNKDIAEDLKDLYNLERFWATLEDNLIGEYTYALHRLLGSLMDSPGTEMTEEEKVVLNRCKVIALSGPRGLLPIEDVRALRSIASRSH